MKTFEYFLLPEDGSHVQDLLFRVKDEDGFSKWEMSAIHAISLKKYGKALIMTQFAEKYADHDKIKVYECKIVRKNVRRTKKV